MKNLIAVLFFSLALVGGDTIEYDLKDAEVAAIRDAYQVVIEAKAEYDAVREKLEAAIKETDEELERIKKAYGHGGRRKVTIRGSRVEVELIAKSASAGYITQALAADTYISPWTTTDSGIVLSTGTIHPSNCYDDRTLKWGPCAASTSTPNDIRDTVPSEEIIEKQAKNFSPPDLQ